MASSRYPPTRGRWQDYKVSSHFTLGEFIRDDDLVPSAARMRMVRTFARKYLEPLRRVYGAGYIVSGHRTPVRNREVGGAQHSWHVWEWHPGEMAVDVVFERGTPREWYATADQLHPGGLGVYTTHIHIDNRSYRARW